MNFDELPLVGQHRIGAGEIALARSCAQRGLDIDPLDPFANFSAISKSVAVLNPFGSFAFPEKKATGSKLSEMKGKSPRPLISTGPEST